MKTSDLRRTYLDFFKSKNHRVYSSDSLVPHNDPSLLFTGAGMNQFKPYFLGLKKDVTRATSCQKCLRTADLDRVGKTAYHHSFFEMLGNFSFGDYFKEEAIAWGWEFVTKALLLPEDKLWVSVYEEDDEAFGIWKNKIGLSESRIVRMGAEDNFWPSNAPKDGPNGPCGPCSEIYVGREAGKGVEIWNLVFTQFDRQSDGSLKPLPQKNIDTGMGLERTAAVLQGVNSNFENDLFVAVRRDLKHLTDRSRAQGSDAEITAHENAVMDHVRAAVFAIADGANPSSEGRGYVIRKVIRLASDHLRRAGARESGTLKALVSSITGVMGSAYPEIVRAQKSAESVIENEERAYEEARRKVESAKKGSMTAAEFAFMLYDTHGVPMDDIREKFARENYAWDEEAFARLLDEQKERSRGASKIAGEIFKKDEIVEKARDLAPTSFLGYDSLETEARLVLIIKPGTNVQRLVAGDEGVLVFDRSPFYAESGGQVGDAGSIESKQFAADVVDTQYADRIITHRVRITRGEASAGIIAQLRVDPKRRADVMKNHTATHLLHAALRKVLGDHVKQAGSLVAPDYLRFDFTHPKALDAAQIAQIESLVLDQIRGGSRLEKKVMSKEQATAEGAIAFFGEKYGDEVRVVSIGGFSKELCGGTHLDSASEIGRFKITSEGSIQAGVRRIEAVTGRGADLYFAEQEKVIGDLSREFSAPAEVLPGALRVSREGVGSSRARLMAAVARTAAKKMNGQSALFVQRLDGADADLFKSIGDELRGLGKPFAALLAGSASDKAAIAVMVSADLAAGGFPSGKIVKEISVLVEGSGGGRSDFAVGGGKRIDRLGDAMTLGEQRLREELTRLNRL